MMGGTCWLVHGFLMHNPGAIEVRTGRMRWVFQVEETSLTTGISYHIVYYVCDDKQLNPGSHHSYACTHSGGLLSPVEAVDKWVRQYQSYNSTIKS